jgi:hypothetical protein
MIESNQLAGQIDALRKMRAFYLNSIAESANEIAATDAEIERLNMQNVGDEGL